MHLVQRGVMRCGNDKGEQGTIACTDERATVLVHYMRARDDKCKFTRVRRKS